MLRRLRVATYNIHWCVGTDGSYNMDRVAQVIRSLNADVVCLQEVHRCTSRFPDDQLLYLSRHADMPHTAFAKTQDGYPHNSDATDTVGEYGNGILSRVPILRNATLAFPVGTGYSRSQEPRNALVAYVPHGDHIVGVVCTHLGCDVTGCEQSSAVPVLNAYAENVLRQRSLLNVCGFVLGGDLNVSSWREAYRSLLAAGWADADSETPAAGAASSRGGSRTMPSWCPVQRIDYLLRMGDGIATVAPTTVVTADPVASDHLPVVAEFSARPEQESTFPDADSKDDGEEKEEDEP